MGTLTQGDTGELDPEAARQAKLAAMSRAASGTGSLAGTTGPVASSQPYQQSGGNAPIGPLPAAGTTSQSATTTLNTAMPSGTDVAPLAPSQNAPATPGSSQADAIQRALTGGSMGSVQSPDASSANAAYVAAAIAAANAANDASRAPSTTTAPPPNTTTTTAPGIGTGTTGTGTTGTTAKTSAGGGNLSAVDAMSSGFAGKSGTTGTTGAGAGTTGDTTGAGTTGAGSGTTGGPGGAGDLGALTGSIVNQIQSLGQSLTAPGTPSDVSAMYMRSAQSILSMLDQQEATLRADAQKNGTTLDPATLFTIDQLKQTLDKNLTGVREDLNRRGLYDSGIELQLENNLQKGSASDQAQILGQRMSKLQDQLTAGLQQIGNQRITTASQYGLAGANAQSSWDENTRKLAQDAQTQQLQSMLALRGQVNSANTAAMGEQGAMQRALLGEQGQNMRASASNQNALQLEAMRRAVAGSGGGSNTPTQINNPYGGQTKTGNNVDANLTNNAIQAVSQYPDRASATQSLAANADALQARGVDVQALSDAIDAQFPPAQAVVNGQRRVGGPI